ncbi:MAG: hypothetical protein ACRD4R_06655 [Candidatus Acidiferrales bacterium]
MWKRLSAAFARLKAAGAEVDKWRWTARSTVFAAFFAGTAFYLALDGRLSYQYVSAITAVHAFLIARAVAEDRKERKDKGNDDDDDHYADGRRADDSAS